MGPDRRRSARGALGLGCAALAVCVACNAALGAGAVAVVGGAGYLAAQCYDRVRVRVRDQYTGMYTCDARVTVSEGDSERRLRPCYNAALTSGKYRIVARQPGYEPAQTDIVIPEHPDDCPRYTHSVELTLRREGDAAQPAQVTPQQKPGVPPAAVAPAAASPAAASPAAASPAAVPPAAGSPPDPVAPAQPSQPAVPTRSFEPVPADAGAPR